tara:strand:+ start:14029 stop:14484 length:456 start_codon:yes stop_codon:yes gene_type:complete
MRRYDKKVHIKRVNQLFEGRCLNETIKASEAYHDFDAMMTVLRGKRSVAFLLAPTVKQWYEKYIKNNNSVDLMTVKRDGVGIYGDAYIIYNDVNKAKILHSVMMKHDGYLSDDTPEEAIENGEALEYGDVDIKSFTDGHYGEGSYDKVKKN